MDEIMSEKEKTKEGREAQGRQVMMELLWSS
jgi:hypothetical protein